MTNFKSIDKFVNYTIFLILLFGILSFFQQDDLKVIVSYLTIFFILLLPIMLLLKLGHLSLRLLFLSNFFLALISLVFLDKIRILFNDFNFNKDVIGFIYFYNYPLMFDLIFVLVILFVPSLIFVIYFKMNK